MPIGSPAGTTAQAASGWLSVTVTVSGPGDLDALTKPDEAAWAEERRPHLIY